MKRIKDPVYGYIDLPNDLVAGVIDTAEFQRLRRIVQTSYAPLFPSALHNRFVHSLGVYHLGSLAAESLERSLRPRFGLNEGLEDYWKRARTTFELACLLHDVGHAPFSHTGESLYARGDSGVDGQLRATVSDPRFSADSTQAKGGALRAAPHEVMSALLGLQLFRDRIPISDLFARCITGYRYEDPLEEDFDYLGNILISLLNSTIIDVDKLDYLIRDAYVTGFDSMHLDYDRLLRSVRVVGKKRFRLAFHKSAVSVLENVVYARDLEKRWIQAHPATLYEQYLVEHMARAVGAEKAKDGDGLFVRDALTSKGVCRANGETVRLLSDDDVLHYAKRQFDRDETVREYFERSRRRHPLWKSEAEFRSLFCLDAGRDKSASKDLCRAFRSLIAKLKEQRLDPVLTTDTIALVEKDVAESKTSVEGESILARYKSSGTNDMVRVLRVLEAFSTKHEVKFNYVLLSQASFRSTLGSANLAALRMVFSDDPDAASYEFGDVCPGVTAQGASEDVFYLFHHQASSEGFPREELVAELKNVFRD